MSEINDQNVIALQAKLAEKKAALVQVKPAYNTNMQFKYYIGGPSINLHTVSDCNILVAMMSVILREKYYFFKAQEALEAHDTVFKWEGFTADDWMHDLKMKMDIINYQLRKAEYEQIEKRLLALESDDLKTEKELEAIMKLLSK